MSLQSGQTLSRTISRINIALILCVGMGSGIIGCSHKEEAPKDAAYFTGKIHTAAKTGSSKMGGKGGKGNPALAAER